MSVDGKFDVGACMRAALAPLVRRARARMCLRVLGNDRSSHMPGIRPDRIRKMHSDRDRERDWRMSTTTGVTFMTYEKHFEELRSLSPRERKRVREAGRTNDESSTRSWRLLRRPNLFSHHVRGSTAIYSRGLSRREDNGNTGR